jgi:hypothetical protein
MIKSSATYRVSSCLLLSAESDSGSINCVMKQDESSQHNRDDRAAVERYRFAFLKLLRSALVNNCKGGNHIVGAQRRFEAGDGAGGMGWCA